MVLSELRFFESDNYTHAGMRLDIYAILMFKQKYIIIFSTAPYAVTEL